MLTLSIYVYIHILRMYEYMHVLKVAVLRCYFLDWYMKIQASSVIVGTVVLSFDLLADVARSVVCVSVCWAHG